MSKATEACDRGDKQKGYLSLASVQHFVLVSQREPRVEVYTRQADGSFRFDVLEQGAKVHLDRIGVTITVDDLYAGVKPTVGGVALDFGVIYYGYTGSGSVNSDLNAIELKAAASYPLGPVTVGAAAYYSPENGGFGDEKTLYLEANAAYTLASGPTVSAAVGTFKVDNIPAPAIDSYVTYNVGVTMPFAERFSVDLRYHGSDSDAETVFGPDIADDHFVATLKATF